jgi:aminoglycoside phosphotransferase (APT) family kinase protein
MALPEVAPVRAGEELDPGALAAYLRGKLEGAEQGIIIEQFPGGHSNLTYLVRAGGREYVLRRPPLGPVAPTAHDMAREFAAGAPTSLARDAQSKDRAIAASYGVRAGPVLRREIPTEYSGDPNSPPRERRFSPVAQPHSVDIEAPRPHRARQTAGFWNGARLEQRRVRPDRRAPRDK